MKNEFMCTVHKECSLEPNYRSCDDMFLLGFLGTLVLLAVLGLSRGRNG